MERGPPLCPPLPGELASVCVGWANCDEPRKLIGLPKLG